MKKFRVDTIGFDVKGARYVYDSIGVAANPNYGSVEHRKGNAFKNSTSHFEIKFIKHKTIGELPHELLCLNIHLKADENERFGQRAVCERLKQGIRLFYSELGVLRTELQQPRTILQLALNTTLDDFERNGFSCEHPTSREVLEEKHRFAKSYTPTPPSSVGSTLWAATEPYCLGNESHFPALAAAAAKIPQKPHGPR